MTTRQRLRALLRRVYSRLGVGLLPYNASTSFACSVGKVLDSRRIATVLDVGGNEGQFGLWLREIGYTGRIVSIEPGPQAHAHLSRVAASDLNWRVLPPLALGAQEGTAEFNVTRNSQCSSILRMDPAAAVGNPDFEVIERRLVRVTTLERLAGEYAIDPVHCYLKLDVQGFEMKVLHGGGSWLERLPAIQLEASVTPLYKGESEILDLSTFLLERGFRFGTINPMLVDEATGCMGQCDIVYARVGA